MFRLIIILLLLAVSFLIYNNYDALRDYEEERVEFQNNVGALVVIDVDTFIVVDFNQVMNEYTLNNGLVVNRLLVEANKIP